MSIHQSANSAYYGNADTSNSQVCKAERNLLAAIMGRAILDLLGDAAIDRLVVANARAWLYDPLDFEAAFSFGWVSRTLNIDPIIIRNQISNYSEDRESLLKALKYLR